MMQLRYYPGNASMIVHILLEELALPFELKLVDRNTGAHKTPDYLKLNPNGLIPVLIDGDLVLYETAAICLHLADTYPAAALAPPPGSADCAQCYKWLMWMTNTVQAALLLYYYPERWVDEGNSAAAAQIKAHAETKVGAMLDQIEAHFVERQRLLPPGAAPQWFLGADYSLLDAYALVLCRWTRGFAHPARSRPLLGAYLQRMLARPAVQRVFATEKLPPPLV